MSSRTEQAVASAADEARGDAIADAGIGGGDRAGGPAVPYFRLAVAGKSGVSERLGELSVVAVSDGDDAGAGDAVGDSTGTGGG